MQTVILAGGRGSRLGSLTHVSAKPMIPIHDKPFLQHQLELIRVFGLTDILLLVGYLGSQIESYFGNGADFGLNITYSHEARFLGTGGALKYAEKKLAEEFLLLNGDTYLAIDYNELISYVCRSLKLGVIVVYRNLKQIAANNISINESNLVTGYSKKNPETMTHVDAGVMAFKKGLLRYIPKARISSLEEETFPKLIRMRELLAFPTNQRYYDMGTPEGLNLIKEILKS